MANALIKLFDYSDGSCVQLDISGKIDTPEEARAACEAMDHAFADPLDSVVLLEGDETPYHYSDLKDLAQFKTLEDYQAQLKKSERIKKLGAFLAQLPPSPEEDIPTDSSITIAPRVAYPLKEIWKGLPESLRVFLTGVKDLPELAISYEPVEAGIGGSARWRLFDGKTSAQGSGASGPGLNGSAPGSEPSLNLPIGSTLAGGAIMVGLSLGLEKLLPDLKPEARNSLNLATLYVGNYLLSRSNLVSSASWEAFAGQLPGMFSLGMIFSLLVDRVGAISDSRDFQFGGLGHSLATMGLTLGAVYTLLGSRTLSPLITGGAPSTGSMAALAKESGLPWLARGAASGLSWKAPAGGAGVWGGIGQGLKVAGWFGIANLLLGGIKSLANPVGQDPEKKLDDFADQIFRSGNATGLFGKYLGGVVDGCLGSLGESLIDFIGLFSSRVKEGRELKRLEIKNELTEASMQFGDFVRKNLSGLVAQSIEPESGTIDWARVQNGLQKLYAENAEDIQNHYNILQYTGHRAPEAQEIKDLIRADGSFDSSHREALKKIVRQELAFISQRNEESMLRLLREMGAIREEGRELYAVPEALLTPEQRKRMEEEVLPLVGQNESIQSTLELLNENK